MPPAYCRISTPEQAEPEPHVVYCVHADGCPAVATALGSGSTATGSGPCMDHRRALLSARNVWARCFECARAPGISSRRIGATPQRRRARVPPMNVLPRESPSWSPAGAEATRPFIKWAGGKRQLLPDLLRFVPSQYGTYYEPFVGGAALFFALHPQNAVLSDLNERLIRTYCGIATDVEGVIGMLSRWPHSRICF